MHTRRWSDNDLRLAVKSSFSIRQVLKKLNLVPAGGNYIHVQRLIREQNISTAHLKGKGWSKGINITTRKSVPLKEILVENSYYNSHRLKKRLFKAEILKEKCALCGWNRKALDGRIPLELDHINGDHTDQRLINLRVLCPNCHSLQLTHRGLNKQIRRGGGIGRRPALKKLWRKLRAGSTPALDTHLRGVA